MGHVSYCYRYYYYICCYGSTIIVVIIIIIIVVVIIIIVTVFFHMGIPPGEAKTMPNSTKVLISAIAHNSPT